MRFVIAILFAGVAFGQSEREKYSLGAQFGYGWYHDGTIFSGAETLQAGIRNRFAASIRLGDDFSDYVSAEIRYTYQDGHPFLQGNGVKVDVQGESHAITYGLLVHFVQRERKFRPYVSGGVGAKGYIISGPLPFPQPVPQIAYFKTNDVWKAVFTAGGGFSYRPRRHLLLRAEFIDYITTFPRQQIVPAMHNTARGVLQQFTPLFGADYQF
jgi:opacity protein-like surface antigen